MSRDINRVLLPGEEQTVQAWGDFVYCKVATLPVHVAMDSQIVEMQAGDKLRERERFKAFRIENRSADTVVYVTLVVGDGDYQSQIIRGEVAVQPKLLTEDGTLREDSRYWLSLYLRPEPGYTPVTYSYLDTVKQYTDALGVDMNYEAGLEWLPVAGVWMARDRFGLHREFTDEWEFVQEYDGPNTGGSDEQLYAATDNDTAIFYLAGDRVRYAPRTSSDSGDTVITQTPSGNTPDYNRDDLVTVGDALWFYDHEAKAVYSASIDSVKAAAPVWSEVVSGFSKSSAFIEFDGRLLHIISRSNNYAEVWDPETGQLQWSQSMDWIASASGYRAGLLYLWRNSEGLDSVDWLYAKWAGEGPDTINVKAIAEPAECRRPAGMIDTAGWQFTLADLSATAGLMGEINASGEIIRAALALYAGKVDAPDGYMDHVYAVSMNSGTGSNKKAVRANQTFAAAGVADDFRMTIPGRIDLQIDALMFND